MSFSFQIFTNKIETTILKASAILILGISICYAQITGPEVTIDFNPVGGLIYALLLIFFCCAYLTPLIRFIYVVYLQKWFNKAMVEVKRMSNRFSERVSDVGRKPSQSTRV